MPINNGHAPSQSRIRGRENLRIGFYFAGLIFVVCHSTAKTAKIGPLEIFPLYSTLVWQSCYVTIIPYSRKFWWGIKFGGLAMAPSTAKLKSAIFFPVCTCMYVWRYRTISLNLNPPIVRRLGQNRPPIFPAILTSPATLYH